MQKEQEIDVQYVSINYQLADPLTKAFSKDKFKDLVEQFRLYDDSDIWKYFFFESERERVLTIEFSI